MNENKMLKYILIITFLIFSGCSSLKEDVGEYVTDAVRQKIASDVDSLLEKRGLSVKEFKQILDSNNDGKITKEESLFTIKDTTKNYVLLEARNYVEQKMKENEAKLHEQVASKNELESKAREFWQLVLGLVAAYLTKQIYSAKSDGKRDERLAILEKLLNKDIDGDGTIGTIASVVTDQTKKENPKT